MATAQSRIPKHQEIYQALQRELQGGQWKQGDRLPSEAELVRRFGASRITVGRAVRDLQRAGLVDRRAGSGTYVRKAHRTPSALSFGLLIPDLGETEIFEPICRGMMASPLAREHALVWGSSTAAASREERAWDLCRQYIDRQVSGVFFAPLERSPVKDDVNSRIAQALDDASIPILLLDRTVLPYPQRGHHDLVGIDNRRAGFLITDHLLRLGCRRIAFVGVPDAAATVDAREAGYREALYIRGGALDRALVHRLDPADASAVSSLLESTQPEGIVCANDWTAARLMHTVLRLGHAIPRDVRIVGIDDLEYASLLPVPLTTLRQPTADIGAAALAAMLERVSRPTELATRDILLHAELVVRESCGGSRRPS
jgi:GntR family transcriptional regulator, arabinose operon transcriptional repressor